jgi:LacI family transcriptional regulator
VNLVIGRDIALVSFDDLERAEAMTPPLTAAAQPLRAIGARAVRLLARNIADPLASREIVWLPAAIEHRHRCGVTATTCCAHCRTRPDPAS